jgi:hypothetical protein
MKSGRESQKGASTLSPDWEKNVRAEVERVVASSRRPMPPRRARLLRYLVERTLKGEAHDITEYAIALDVFDRPDSFDPKTDAVVRAEMSRLRQSLSEYYTEVNGEAQVSIVLPPRSYIPEFSLQQELAKPVGWKRQQWFWPGAIGIALAGALTAVWLLSRSITFAPPELALAVLPLTIAPAAEGYGLSPDLAEAYYGPLLRTAGLSLLEWRVMKAFRGPDAVAGARRRLPVSMILQTVIDRRASSLEAKLTVFNRSDGTVIWTQAFPLQDASKPDAALIEIALDALRPLFESRFNRHLFEVRNGLAKSQNPCAHTAVMTAFLRPRGSLEIHQETLNATSFDTRIAFRIADQTAYDGSIVPVRDGVPLPIQPPLLIQLSQDTCVLVSENGSVPVYDNACIVPHSGPQGLDFHYQCTRTAWPVDLSALANSQRLWNEDRVPTGARILAGIPFLIPDGKSQEWKADAAAEGGARPVSLTIPVNRKAVSRAFFLLDTEWGQPGPQSYLSIEFTGDKGARFIKPLIGGVDVRDYHHGIYTTTINGTSSRLAYQLSSEEAIDVVQVDLPPEFGRQTLESITLRDTGRHNFQRAILRGVTVQ